MDRPVLSSFLSNDRFSSGTPLRNGRDPVPNERVSTSASRNPLALRLYKSLSSNFQDAASQEALEILSSLYGTSPELHPAPRTAVHGGDASSSDDEDARELSYDKNEFAGSVIESRPIGDVTIAERARKNSRRDIEQMLIANSIRFLHAFGDVNKVCMTSIMRCFMAQ